MKSIDRDRLVEIVRAAVGNLGGEASIVEVAKYIWDRHEPDLKASGDLFYTWQYEMRWAAQRLRDANEFALGKRGGKQTWRKV